MSGKLVAPIRGVITALSGESGSIETEAGPIRFGVSACSGFAPAVGLAVWVMSFRDLPIVGPRATLVNLTGEGDLESIEARVARDLQRSLAMASVGWRIDDALAWLGDHPDHYASDRFHEPGSALAMVKELLGAGAVHVALLGSGSRERNAPSSMEVELPTDAHARRLLFALFARESSDRGEDFEVSPDGRNESEATGEADDELAPDIGPPLDAGQLIVTLWWD